MPGPLHGVKVLDLSVMVSGPLAAMILADQGADVLKVESPGLGDIMRFLGTQKGGMTGIFANSNRGKRSLVVDLKRPEGADILRRLAADADVLLQNFRPGAMERLGLGYDDLAAVNSRLVYVSISGYGPDGPHSHRRVYDNVIQAASGFAAVQADPITGVPQMLRTLVCDKVTAWTVAQAITAALFARATGAGAGQHLTVAMLDSAIAFLWPDAAMDKAVLADDAHRTPTIGANYTVARMADGYCAGSAVSDAEFRGWCAAIARPELADDPRFATAADRMANVVELIATMRESAAQVTVADFLERAEQHDVPASPINTLDALLDDPQVRHNDVFVERVHPVAGPLREARPAVRFSATPQELGAPAPTFGQHSDDVVAALGLDPQALRAAGVIS
jgi:crotonobetainyl-CoA:carnitine CoA-transferase CaiB-like acyl-CoA transferase